MNNPVLQIALMPLFFLVAVPVLGQESALDVQGHRGCRGLYPENSIPAFKHAIDLGVTTLEMDVVLSSENTWIVSHEPWLNPEICKDIQGRLIDPKHARTYNIYWLTDAEIKACDCGSIGHPKFPEQKIVPAFKATLEEVLSFCEEYTKDHGLKAINYNIEIKSQEEWEGTYQPSVDEYVDFLTDFMDGIDFTHRITIQSFDERILRSLHDQRPDWRLSFLVSNLRSLQSNIKWLGFTPSIYSPNFRYVTRKTIEQAEELGIQVIPWTVNNESAMKRLIDLGVDGIITDYPDRLLSLIKQ